MSGFSIEELEVPETLDPAAGEFVAAIEVGNVVAIAYVGGRQLGGARLNSPTGYGSIAADARATRFLQSRGYTFEQVERLSRLQLPVAGLDALVAAAQEASGADYRVHTWVERVRDGDDRRESNPRRHLVAAAEHILSGRLVAYSALSVPRQPHRAVQQYATLVLREHRGHRLGMLVKVANLAHLAAVSPVHPSILTFNAEENRHMLDVNEALGFTSVAYEGAWRKDLS